MSERGNWGLGSEAIPPLLVLIMCAWAAEASGASRGTALFLLAVPALLSLAWLAFVLRQWLTVYVRFHDRYYHLFEKKILSKEYRDDPSPYKGHQK